MLLETCGGVFERAREVMPPPCGPREALPTRPQRDGERSGAERGALEGVEERLSRLRLLSGAERTWAELYRASRRAHLHTLKGSACVGKRRVTLLRAERGEGGGVT